MTENGSKSNGLVREADDFIRGLEKSDSHFDERLKSYRAWKACPPPTTRDEYWKYTRLGPFLKKTYSPPLLEETFRLDFQMNEDVYTLTYINGLFSKELSVVPQGNDFFIGDLSSEPSDIQKSSISETRDYFSLLNDAFHLAGPVVVIRKNFHLDKPLRIQHFFTEQDRLVNVKGKIILEPGANANIAEVWDNKNARDGLFNSRTDTHIMEGASLIYTKLQLSGEENSLICQDFIELEKSSSLRIHTISLNSRLIRNNLNIRLIGEGAECQLNGMYLLKGKEHVDNHTYISHEVPNCESSELYKGIMSDHSKGVFNGKVEVRPQAQKTNAFQYNANILLSDDAEVYSKPELEIYADDVKCSHGSTTGQLDSEALFYLKSRGISGKNARNLLVSAFASELIEKIADGDLKDRITMEAGDFQLN